MKNDKKRRSITIDREWRKKIWKFLDTKNNKKDIDKKEVKGSTSSRFGRNFKNFYVWWIKRIDRERYQRRYQYSLEEILEIFILKHSSNPKWQTTRTKRNETKEFRFSSLIPRISKSCISATNYFDGLGDNRPFLAVKNADSK